MDSIEQTVQNKLVADYRKNYLWTTEFSDEELALLCPVSDEDIKAFIVGKRSQVITHMVEVDDKILDVKREIQDSQDVLDDPRSISEAQSEARRDISYANNKLRQLVEEKEKLFRVMVEFDVYERNPLTDAERENAKQKIVRLIDKIQELIAKYREDVELLEKIRDNPRTPSVDSREASNDIVYDNIRIYGFMFEKDKLVKRLKYLGWDEDDKRSR